MKRLIILMLSVVILLTACSNKPIDDESKANSGETKTTLSQETQAEKIDDQTKTQLSESAKLLTKAIICSTDGFSYDVKNPTTKITPASEKDQNSVVTFLIMMMYYSNPEHTPQAENTIYNGLVYMDKNDMYHLNESAISVLLKDVFGIQKYDESINVLVNQLNFSYDKKTDEYVSALEFGAKYDWDCKEITKVKIDTDAKEITVEYKAQNLMSFADGAKEEITEYNCKNVYTFDSRESNEYYLKLKSVEVLDFVKTANPDL